ncbi:hypothetical protein MED222_06015 [Vibrio sp. MED222]|nr:hypothetical protein MED222_06015 [Vibrio sp. MED222]
MILCPKIKDLLSKSVDTLTTSNHNI